MDDSGHAIPRFALLRELAAARGRERVEAGAAIRVGRAPGAAHEASLLQAHQRRVERAHVELKHPARDLLEASGDGVAMHRTERVEGLQNHQVERALQHVCLLSDFVRHSNGIALVALERQMELLARNGIFTGFVTSFRINNLEMVDQTSATWNRLAQWFGLMEALKKAA
jgi:hypothetical protein